jgi:hypothetical protein
MTDPFADLERELAGAHARDVKPLRHRAAAGRLVAAVAAVAAVALSFAVLAGIAADDDPERAAAPPAAPGDCRTAVATSEPAPAEIAGRLSILRRGKPQEIALGLIAGQAKKLYGPPRSAPPTVDWDVAVAAAEIVPRSALEPDADPCAAPAEATEPGVCLILSNAEGGLAACFTVAELMEGKAFIDANGEIIGLAADGVRTATAGDDTCEPADNVFRLPGGPETRVQLRS